MRGKCFSWALALSLFASGAPSPVSAENPRPKARSFRPVVPIAQSVRATGDQKHTQTVSVRIPPPPVPDELAVPTEAPETPVKRESDSELLPPAPTAADNTPVPAKEKTAPLPESDHTPEPREEKTAPAKAAPKDGPTLTRLREEAHLLASKKLRYVFGADDPKSGGLDCSSTIQYLLNKIGVKDVPRTSYDQYYWLKRKKMLDDVYGKSSNNKLLKKLAPGDLIFWGGTWKSGHRVSHVMLYMGYDPAADKHYVFGARSKSTTGLTGAGVDIFELNTESGRLVAHGKIPGLIYE